jgi:parallel beta-helix repeat protein
MSYQVINPFIQFVNPANGQPLSVGQLYFGRKDSDPKNQPANRINVYAVQDNGAEVLLSQPIQLNAAGQPQYNGSVKQIKVELYTGEDAYAVAVYDKNAALKSYCPRVGSVITTDELAEIGSTVVIAGTEAWKIANAANMFVNVKNFGAKGDGVTDDYLAINQAVKFAADNGGGVVFYPKGTYLISRAIRLDTYDVQTFAYNTSIIRKNITHMGAGRGATVIKPTVFWCSIFSSFPEPFLPAAAKSETVTCENLTICDMTLDCNYDAVVDGGAAYGPNYASWGGTWPNGTTGASTWAADNYQYPIYVWNGDNVTIANCEIKNSWYNGIEIYKNNDVIITDNIISHCGDKPNYLGYYAGVQLDNGTIGATIDGNVIQDCGNGIMSNGDPLPYARDAVSNVIVSNNILRDIEKMGLYAFDWIESWNVEGNQFINIGLSAIEFLDGGGTNPERKPANCKVSTNIIRNFNLNNVAGTVAIRGFGYNHTITGNTILQNSSTVTAETYGIFTDSTGVTPPAGITIANKITDNYVAGYLPATANGAHISVASPNTTVTGNTLIAATSASIQAVRVAANNVDVSANMIVGAFSYSSGLRPVRYVSGTTFSMSDRKCQPYLAITTTAAKVTLTGWNVVDFAGVANIKTDNRGNFNNGTNAFVADVPAVYEFQGMVVFSGLGSNDLTSALFEVNGTTSYGAIPVRLDTSGGYLIQAIIPLNAGDSVTMKMYSAGASYTQDVGTQMIVSYVQMKV